MANKRFINGKWKEIALAIAETVDRKNNAYGNSFMKCGDVMKILYPDGIRPDQFIDALAITRVIDKLFRIANGKGAMGECEWKDICGYAILSINNDNESKKKL